MTTNITDEHRRAFEALTGGRYENFALVSCFCAGKPATAIATVTVHPPAKTAARPNTSLPHSSCRSCRECD